MAEQCTSEHHFQHGTSEAAVKCQRDAPHRQVLHGAALRFDDDSTVTWEWPVTKADFEKWDKAEEKPDG